MSNNNGLSFLMQPNSKDHPKLERSLLRDQAIDLLRDYLVSGRIPPGTKLVEREVATLLGISRAPVRDALMELEKEGLVVTRSNGRYVIRLTERDVLELYQVRRMLERLAVELAAKNTCPENCATLTDSLEVMREAITNQDRSKHVAADVETHWLIWRQADNAHLFRMLSSMIGPIFMFVANNADAYDWNETLGLHEELVRCINAGDVRASAASLDRHMDNALHRSLQVFRTSKAIS